MQLLQQRAFLLAEIRRFFHQRKVMEVETPILSEFGNTDVQIDMFSSQPLLAEQHRSFLRTSPEFFHKRLLAGGSGDLFEIAKVFRRGERSHLHNPEFTLLEWYREGFDWAELMTEVIDLVQFLQMQLAGEEVAVETIAYQDLFIKCAAVDPFAVELEALQAICENHGYTGSALNRTTALDYIFALIIQPQLIDADSFATGLMVHDFPIEMAALSQMHPTKPDRCLRFEFLWHGVELANGYQELSDPIEQHQRFIADNQMRCQMGKTELPIDDHLLAALSHGLPACSGVAMGVERLMMCLLGYESIDQVMGFQAENS